MLFFNRDEDENDKKGERLAKKYGLHYEYREARRRGMNPYEAMDDWDLPQEELNDMD